MRFSLLEPEFGWGEKDEPGPQTEDSLSGASSATPMKTTWASRMGWIRTRSATLRMRARATADDVSPPG